MYHELESSGRSLCQTDPGYVRYVLKEVDFRSQIQWLAKIGWRGFNVSQGLDFSSDPGVVITFDDGAETDLLLAAPILRNDDFQATFYITAGFLGQRGYLTSRQLQELSSLGFEIGCHSMTHAYLPDLSNEDLYREIGQAKVAIEQIIGKPVVHFSCPGGRYDRRVIDTARNAGFQTLATSRVQSNCDRTSRFEMGRVAILRDTSKEAFERICQNQGLWRSRLLDIALSSTKRALGNSNYDKLRAKLLKTSR